MTSGTIEGAGPEGPDVPSGPEPARSGQLIRNTGVTSVAAGAGVASGLLLDVSIAASFGAGTATDAFFVAAKLPIGIASVFMAGANQALVPAISTWLVKKGDDETGRLVSILLTATLVAGFLLAGLVSIVAWPLMRVTAPGLSSSSITLAASLARIMFLIVPLVAGAEVLRAYLNAKHAFAAPAGMNVVMNGGAALLVFAVSHRHMERVAWAYAIGAAAELGFMMFVAVRKGLHYRPSLRVRDPDLISAVRLSGRPLLASGLNPVARTVEQLFVSFLPSGSITILNYANRLVSALGGTVFFRSVMVVLLPRMTKAAATDDAPATSRLTISGVKIMLALSIPLMAFVAVLSKPAALVLFHRGRFSRTDAGLLGLVMAVYAFELLGDGLQRALLAPFFARLDTRTPFRNSVYGVVANLALLPLCILPFGRHTNAMYGVAVAYSAAQYVNVGHAWYRLREIVPRPLEGCGLTAVRLTAASAVAGVNMLIAIRLLHVDAAGISRVTLLLRTCGAGFVGIGALALSLLAFGGHEADQVIDAIFRRGRSRPRAVPAG